MFPFVRVLEDIALSMFDGGERPVFLPRSASLRVERLHEQGDVVFVVDAASLRILCGAQERYEQHSVEFNVVRSPLMDPPSQE